jgi:hypothetical protein
MQICPLAAAQQCHANGRQNEANSCDQHHTQESAPVTIVRGLGGPVYRSIEKIISCTCWGQTPDHPAHSKSLHQLCHPTSCLYIHNTYVMHWYLNPKYKCVPIFFFWAAWWPYMVEKLNIYWLKLNIWFCLNFLRNHVLTLDYMNWFTHWTINSNINVLPTNVKIIILQHAVING